MQRRLIAVISRVLVRRSMEPEIRSTLVKHAVLGFLILTQNVQVLFFISGPTLKVLLIDLEHTIEPSVEHGRKCP